MNTIKAILFDPVDCLADSDGCAYDDAAPALTELKALGIRLIVASMLPSKTLAQFLDSSGLSGFFDDVRSVESTAGDRSTMLRDALTAAPIAPDHALFVTATADGLAAAHTAGVHGILMMNDPDEAMKLTAHKPAGGIVSLLELPDFVRFVALRASGSDAIANARS